MFPFCNASTKHTTYITPLEGYEIILNRCDSVVSGDFLFVWNSCAMGIAHIHRLLALLQIYVALLVRCLYLQFVFTLLQKTAFAAMLASSCTMIMSMTWFRMRDNSLKYNLVEKQEPSTISVLQIAHSPNCFSCNSLCSY